ncbi:MAG TPA: dTMP kinase [Bryobacterales bacterium]|nr:dTMP kinase [Bryobacterales bacterium]
MFYPGAFLTFEGVDGSGKTTQLTLLAERLAAEGHSVVRAQEPGGTRVGNAIRKILLDAGSTDLRAVPELLLYFASRAQNVEEVILPALAAGHIVLADRFTDASMAYQGYGRGLGVEMVEALDRIACRGLAPELTVVIDIDIETSLERALGRNAGAAVNESRMEQEAVEFHRRVREGYLEIGRQEPRRVQVIDGRRRREEIAAEIWALAEGFLAAKKLLRTRP